MERIVIVGGGFGGAYCAQALERRVDRDEAEIVLLDARNYLLFYPLLVEAGTGSLQPRHVTVSIRRFLRRTRFVLAEVEGADLEARTLSYRLGGEGGLRSLEWDQLVLAPGSVTRIPPVPGLDEWGYDMKSLGDAVALRDRAVRLLELASETGEGEERERLLHLVVVGGNFTGVEVAGEFHQLLVEAAERYPHVHPAECRVSLVELTDRILPALEPGLSDFAASRLRRRGIDLRLGRTVDRITETEAVLDDGETLESRTVIWCAGIAPPPLLGRMDLPLDERGYVLCEPDLRVRGRRDVWAIGDAAVNLDPEGRPYPATAQHAVRMGKALAANIQRAMGGQDAEPFTYPGQGTLAAIGCRTGVAMVLGLKISGFWAWFIHRTVYLFKMPGWGRRVRVALDWTLDLFTRRDYVQLGLAGRGEPPDRD